MRTQESWDREGRMSGVVAVNTNASGKLEVALLLLFVLFMLDLT